MKRTTAPKGITVTTFDDKPHDNVRWDSTPGLNKDDLFGLDKVDKSEQTLIVVEGYLDAIYLQTLGMNNITAVGQGMFGKKHLEGLRTRMIKNVIIAFDNDSVGPKNTLEAVELILKNSKIIPYVIDPVNYGNVKDPNEYFKAYGFRTIKKMVPSGMKTGI